MGPFIHWLELPDNTALELRELAVKMAEALHPRLETLADELGLGGALFVYKKEFPRAVQSGALVVRNPLTLGEHSFPLGEALWSAVVLPQDARAFLATYGIGVRAAVVKDTETEALSAASKPEETVKQRGIRRLEMFEAEENRELRGALQRVADLEKVDRSNLGKEIKKARAERDTKIRSGGWGSELVRNGKRVV